MGGTCQCLLVLHEFWSLLDDPVVYFDTVFTANFVGCVYKRKEFRHGHNHHNTVGRIFSALRLVDFPFGSPTREIKVNAMYVLGGIVSVGLLIYLMIALLKAEWF